MAETPARYCGNCGNELDPEDRFCQNCGRPVHRTARVPTPEADVPVPPPPQQEGEAQPLEQAEAQPRRPWTTRQLALGCLGAFFVVFVVGAFLSALAGNGGGGNEVQKNKKSGGGKDTAPKPELVVSSPSGSPTVTKDSIEVKGEVTPATSRVEVNGEGVTPSDDGSFSTPFHLNVGENYIQINAVNGSEQANASRTVTRKLPEKEIAAQGAAEEKAKKGEPQLQKNEEQPQAEKKPRPRPEPRPKPEYKVGPESGACRVVDTFTGSGETRTDTPFFTIVGPHWRVVYESVNIAPPPVEGLLGFFIRNERGQALDRNGVEIRGDNSGIKNVISDPGQYYIQIITAEVDWTIRVEDCGNTTT